MHARGSERETDGSEQGFCDPMPVSLAGLLTCLDAVFIEVEAFLLCIELLLVRIGKVA